MEKNKGQKSRDTAPLMLGTCAGAVCRYDGAGPDHDHPEGIRRSLVLLHVPLCPPLLLPYPHQPQGQPGPGQDLPLLVHRYLLTLHSTV